VLLFPSLGFLLKFYGFILSWDRDWKRLYHPLIPLLFACSVLFLLDIGRRLQRYLAMGYAGLHLYGVSESRYLWARAWLRSGSGRTLNLHPGGAVLFAVAGRYACWEGGPTYILLCDCAYIRLSLIISCEYSAAYELRIWHEDTFTLLWQRASFLRDGVRFRLRGFAPSLAHFCCKEHNAADVGLL
jgi:hypothetical protein